MPGRSTFRRRPQPQAARPRVAAFAPGPPQFIGLVPIRSAEVFGTPANDYRTLVMGLSGLVGYWRLGDQTDIAVDETGSFPGTYTGAYARNVKGSLYGDPDEATTFSGGRVDVPDANALDVTTTYTVLAWIRSTDTANEQTIWGKGPGGAQVKLQGGNVVIGIFGTGNGKQSSFVVADGAWHFIAAIRVASTDYIYVDGVDVSSGTSLGSDPSANSNNAGIGAMPDTQYPFNGTIDEVVLSNADLRTSIASLYTAGRDARPFSTTSVFSVTAVGAIASAEGVGQPVLTYGVQIVTAVGAIASAEGVGTPAWTGLNTLTDVGAIPPPAITVVGTPDVTYSGDTLSAVGGIASGEAVGTPTLAPGAVSVTAVGAIASGEAVGTPSWTTAQQVQSVGAIASAEALGTPVLTVGPVTLTAVGGIASGQAMGTPTWASIGPPITLVGIASGEAVGVPTYTQTQTVTAVGGIASAEAVGIPSRTTTGPPVTLVGIASGEAFGLLALRNLNTLTLVGIASAEAFGTLAVRLVQKVFLVGIASGEAFGLLHLYYQAPPWRRWKSIQYHAIVFSPSLDGLGGPGQAKLELDPDILNLVWQQRQNEAGQAAFALARHNKKLDQINWMVDHIKIFRESSAGTAIVFAGKLIKPIWSSIDVLVYCWDYMAFLQLSRTGYKTAYANKLVGTEIIAPEWAAAKALGNSPFAFVTTGTIENPLANDAVTAIKTNAKFGVVDFDRLFTFSTIAEMAMANTQNNVKFEITRGDGGTAHTFNFWKNYGVNKTAFVAIDPGNLASYQFDGGKDSIRNDLATVLSDGLGGHVEYTVQSSDVNTTTLRRLQAALPIRTLFGENAGTTETDQGKAALARQLVVSQRNPRQVIVNPRQGEFEPFIDAELGDKVLHIIANANRDADMHDAYLRLVSVSGAWDVRHGELLQLESRGLP
jgi:hypothetical protein